MAQRRQLPKNPKAYWAMEMIARGEKQSDVADYLNVAQSTVSSWKRQIEGTGGRPNPPAAPRTSTSYKKSSHAMQVCDTKRTAIVEPGRIIFHEHTRSSTVSEAMTQRRTAPIENAKKSSKSSYSQPRTLVTPALVVPLMVQRTPAQPAYVPEYGFRGDDPSAYDLQESTSSPAFSYGGAGPWKKGAGHKYFMM